MMFTRYQMPIIITWHAFSALNHRTNICYAIPWRKCAVISKYHFLFVNQEATEHKITNFRFSVICLFGKTLCQKNLWASYDWIIREKNLPKMIPISFSKWNSDQKSTRFLKNVLVRTLQGLITIIFEHGFKSWYSLD